MPGLAFETGETWGRDVGKRRVRLCVCLMLVPCISVKTHELQPTRASVSQQYTPHRWPCLLWGRREPPKAPQRGLWEGSKGNALISLAIYPQSNTGSSRTPLKATLQNLAELWRSWPRIFWYFPLPSTHPSMSSVIFSPVSTSPFQGTLCSLPPGPNLHFRLLGFPFSSFRCYPWQPIIVIFLMCQSDHITYQSDHMGS